jgi:hypothetical protein
MNRPGAVARCILVSVIVPATAAEVSVPADTADRAVSPGGRTDILSRVIAVPATETLGQTVVVDNRGRAGSAIGTELAANANPNGYTLILVSSSYAATAAYRKPTYDPIDGIDPIILIGTTGLLMITHPSVTAKSIPELIAYASQSRQAELRLGRHRQREPSRARGVPADDRGQYRPRTVQGGPALQGVIGNEVRRSAPSASCRRFPMSGRGGCADRRHHLSAPPLLPDVGSIGGPCGI